MGRQEIRRKVYLPLRRAGLEVVEGEVPAAPLPVFAVGMARSCDGDTAGLRWSYVDRDDPGLIEQANQDWYELATSSGLFGTDREFLLALPAHRFSVRAAARHRRSVWRRVRLLDDWDVMGAACAIRLGTTEHGFPQHLLGFGAGYPGFAMLSLDSTVAMLGTTEEDCVGSIVVPNPGDIEIVRNMITSAANRIWDPREEWFMAAPRIQREEALAWLRRNEPATANRA